MEIFAKIEGLSYRPLLCDKLKVIDAKNLEALLLKTKGEGSFIAKIDDKNSLAISKWVSPKRTRSYPYGRVYNTLSFSGKKVTIIPFVKDEGLNGDRDFLQWDTISLMSLLDVYVIISYYKTAEKNYRYTEKNPGKPNKITNQKFDIAQIKLELDNLLSFKASPLHWNLSQIEKIHSVGERSLQSYREISLKTGVIMTSESDARKKMDSIYFEKETFKSHSRDSAKRAQYRESVTTHAKEKTDGDKSIITIENYLGGNYFFTCDEAYPIGDSIYLVEAKNTKDAMLPSKGDIIDGVVKMIIFSNLTNVEMDKQKYTPIPVLKLTGGIPYNYKQLTKSQQNFQKLLIAEARENKFKIQINDQMLDI